MLGHFEFKVLSAVERLKKNAYGVSIKGFIDDEFSKKTSYGALYTTLSRLEKKGFVESSMGQPQTVRGGRAKKYYKLTADGSHSLAQFKTTIANYIRPDLGGSYA